MIMADSRDFLANKDVKYSTDLLKKIGGTDTDQKFDDIDLGGDVNRVGDYDTFKGLGATQAKSSVSSALTGLQQQASGADGTFDRVESQTLKGLQAQQGSQQQSLANTGAQQGLSGSQTALQGIMMNRQQESAQADVRGDLAIKRSERQRTAVSELGTIGNQANANDLIEKNIEVTDAQFKIKSQLLEDELNQERKIAKENLKSDDEAIRVKALGMVIDAVKTGTDVDAINVNTEAIKSNEFSKGLASLDPTSENFSDLSQNLFAGVYGYESYNDMKAKADSGDPQAKNDLLKFDSVDYDTLKHESYKSNSDEAGNDFGLELENGSSDLYTDSSGGYNVFDVDGNIAPELITSSTENYWNTMMGTVKDPEGNTYTDYNKFREDVANGLVSDKFKKFTNGQVKSYYETIETDAYKTKKAEIVGLKNETKTAYDNGDITFEDYTAKIEEYNDILEYNDITFIDDMTNGENFDEYYVDGEIVKVKTDSEGKVIDAGGLKIVDGEVEGVVSFDGDFITPDDSGFINLGQTQIDSGDGNFSWDSLDEYFETSGSKGDLKDVGYKFIKSSDGTMSVKLTNGENVTVKDITNLPGYEDAKETLKGSDPSDGTTTGDTTTEVGSTITIDGEEFENTGSKYVFDPTNMSDFEAQLEHGNTKNIITSLNDGVLTKPAVDMLYSKKPELISENATDLSGDNISGGKATSKNARATLDLPVGVGGVLNYGGSPYIILETPNDYYGETDNNNDGEDGFWEINTQVYGQKVKVYDLKNKKDTWIYTQIGHTKKDDDIRGLSVGNVNDQDGFIPKS